MQMLILIITQKRITSVPLFQLLKMGNKNGELIERVIMRKGKTIMPSKELV